MTERIEPSQITLLPKQLMRLARFAVDIDNKAIGVSQTGCVIHVDTGTVTFDINAKGTTIPGTMKTKEHDTC